MSIFGIMMPRGRTGAVVNILLGRGWTEEEVVIAIRRVRASYEVYTYA